MKAVILCAGKGTRLGELTQHCAKPALPVGDRPLLAHTVQWLLDAGITEFCVNLHHQPDSILQVFEQHFPQLSPHYHLESRLYGSAGALLPFQEVLTEPFLVLNGDNYYHEVDLKYHLRSRPKSQDFIGRAASAYKQQVTEWDQAGIFAVDMNEAPFEVLGFVEKPSLTALGRLYRRGSLWINAGVYVFTPEVFDYIPQDRAADFGYDVLPRLVAGNALAWDFFDQNAVCQDIGTPQGLAAAQALVKRKVTQV